jgi:hypothetical protein
MPDAAVLGAALRSAMFSFAMILIRDTMARLSRFGPIPTSLKTPSMR